jgi:hypothetical protein
MGGAIATAAEVRKRRRVGKGASRAVPTMDQNRYREWWARREERLCPPYGRSPYFASTGSGGTLSFGAPACMVISVIEVMS